MKLEPIYSTMSLEELKSILLIATKGQPFFFKWFLNNDEMLSKLEKKQDTFYGHDKEKPIEIFLNRDEYNIPFEHKVDGDEENGFKREYRVESIGTCEEESLNSLVQFVS